MSHSKNSPIEWSTSVGIALMQRRRLIQTEQNTRTVKVKSENLYARMSTEEETTDIFYSCFGSPPPSQIEYHGESSKKAAIKIK